MLISPIQRSVAPTPLLATIPASKSHFSDKFFFSFTFQDDFYLNLVDWSSQNVLSVGLGACVYLWSACTSQVTKLCDLTTENDTVTSVSWAERVRKKSPGGKTTEKS